jgi:hypothetical protein
LSEDAGERTETESDQAVPEPTETQERDPGSDYVIGRWRELTSADAVWFGRTVDVGHRLRLSELVGIAEANLAGGVRPEAVEDLLKETSEALKDEGLYVATRFPEVAEEAKELTGRSGASFVPGSSGLASARASLARLQGDEYLEGLVTAMTDAADGIECTLEPLRNLDALVELLDSELAYAGHSRTWRAAAVAEVARRVNEEAQSLKDAVVGTLNDAGCARPRAFSVVVPLEAIGDVDDAPAWMSEPASVSEIIKGWGPTGREEAQARVQGADRAVIYRDLEAVDGESALRLADGRLRRSINVFRLQGRTVEEPLQAIVYDPLTKEATVRGLPSEPLDLMPAGLATYEPRAAGGTLEDALDQLAEARTARPSAAFVDLWTAAEALYGGAIGDRRHKAGLVMIGLAEHSYIADAHIWLARRAATAGIGQVPVGGELRWLMDTLGTGAGARKLDAGLVAAGDLLAWSRFKAMSQWDGGWGLRNELDRLRKRLIRVVDRAYLFRNFAVHRADESSPTLAIMLPCFAGLVQVCIGHSLRRVSSGVDPLTDAKTAALIVRGIADDFGHRRSRAPGGFTHAIEGR